MHKQKQTEWDKYKYDRNLNSRCRNGPIVSYIDYSIISGFPNKNSKKPFLKDIKIWQYEEYINSTEWEAKKKEYFAAFTKQCKICGSYDTLQVHHITYDRLGREALSDLMCLCKNCHGSLHKYHDSTKLSLYQASWRYYFRNRKPKRIIND